MQKLYRSKKLLRLLMSGSLVIGLSMITNEQAVAKGYSRDVARTHVNNYNRSGSPNINRNRDISRNVDSNRNINSNVNVNRNINVQGGYYGGYHGGYYYYDHHHHGVSTGAAVAIGLSALAIGTVIGASQMPPSCSMVSAHGVSYQRCGNTWYQPQYVGSQVNYVVVKPPY